MCPFVNKNDSRCANHWTLYNITQAFLHCADRYATCPAYKELIADDRTSRQADAPPGLLAAF